jgi:hypothetical protein
MADTSKAQRLIQAAGQRQASFDRIDRNGGFAAPSDCSLRLQLKTVEAALLAGINRSDWTCAADALVLLRQAMESM